MITQERLKELLHYDPGTGVFTRVLPRRGCKVGAVAGTPHNRGYVSILVDGRHSLAHRLAFLYMTGEWPTDAVDHINGMRNDNRWANLRPATIAQNGQNMRHARVDNQVGLLGVRKKGKRFAAEIRIDGRHRHLGYFDTPEAAHAAYLAAKAELHPFSTL